MENNNKNTGCLQKMGLKVDRKSLGSVWNGANLYMAVFLVMEMCAMRMLHLVRYCAVTTPGDIVIVTACRVAILASIAVTLYVGARNAIGVIKETAAILANKNPIYENPFRSEEDFEKALKTSGKDTDDRVIIVRTIATMVSVKGTCKRIKAVAPYLECALLAAVCVFFAKFGNVPLALSFLVGILVLHYSGVQLISTFVKEAVEVRTPFSELFLGSNEEGDDLD